MYSVAVHCTCYVYKPFVYYVAVHCTCDVYKPLCILLSCAVHVMFINLCFVTGLVERRPAPRRGFRGECCPPTALHRLCR